MKHEDAQQHRADGTDARPNGIGNAYGDSLCGLRQKHRAQHIEKAEAHNPQPPLGADGQFGLTEAEGEARFTQAGDNKDNPIHLPCAALFTNVKEFDK